MFDPNQAREELEKILRQREYQIYYEETIIEHWWNKAKEWLAEKLIRLFPSYETVDSLANLLLIGIIILVITLFIIAITLIVRHRYRKRKYRERPLFSTGKELDWTYHQHLEEAVNLEKQLNFSKATRHMFLVLLLYFHEKGWLEVKFWKTNWEYYDDIRKVNKTLANQFYHIARVFEDVTYGEYEIEQKEYENYKRTIIELVKPMTNIS